MFQLAFFFTFFFYSAAMAVPEAGATSSTFGLDKIQMAQTQILQAKQWAESSILGSGLNGEVLEFHGLNDCVKLYRESENRLSQMVAGGEKYSQDDARTWLSGVLANHRSCLDGLSEKGFVDQNHTIFSSNFTFLISEALDFYGQQSPYFTKENIPAQNQTAGGILTSWNPGSSRANFIVAKDGSGTHRTINEAVSAVERSRNRRANRVIIYVKAGIYNEKIEIPQHIKNLMLVGDGIDRTIITGNRNVPDGATTLSSATFGVSGDGFWARDITFENTAGPNKHQAVALRVSSDLSVFYRCSFKGYQDTLYVHSLRQFYRDCQIYGTIDFIFGDAPVVFQNCDIFVRRPMSSQANFITAQGRDDPRENTGISIHRSRVRPLPELLAARGEIRTFLGRPWRKYSRTVFMETELDGFIHPSGWGAWHGDYALSTLFYGEYRNTGDGASTSRRVNWRGFHVLNSPQEVAPFTVGRFIQGENWIPASGVPFSLGT
ncbi:probable pectinesterase/pectinesterase inhibitor 36 [Euphorbia lathyris]|uniref:probable pectinesterase/pectinesterase inhibitor 36 n=1 Tax=Euphorbia lathyris TaxID=212925 RepID=UPI00331338F1